MGNHLFESRLRRKRRVRSKISGSPERPRLSVFRSSKHIYAQVIDDSAGKTLVAVSDQLSVLREKLSSSKKTEKAFEVGKLLATRCLELGISKVVFDRNGYLYHGRVQHLADGAREGGLQF